jgi:hypothetical protein
MSRVKALKDQVEQLTGYTLNSPGTTNTPPSGTIPTTGIAPGGIIQSNQILNIINALNGVNVDTIIISGSFNTSGSNVLNGSLALPFIQNGNYLYVTGGLVRGTTAINVGTASFAISSSYASTANRALTASYFSGSISNAVNAIYAQTASYLSGSISNAVSSSYAYNADYLDGKDSTVFATTGSNTFKGNQIVSGSIIPGGLNYDLGSISNPWKHIFVSTGSMYFVSASTIVGTLSGIPAGIFVSGTLSGSTITANSVTASLLGTASYTFTAESSSYAISASYAPNSTSGSYSLSSSFALTASHVLNLPSQSVTASYALTASYVEIAQSASYVTNAQTASYVLHAVSSSYASTSSIAATASVAILAEYATSAGNTPSASRATSAANADNATSSSYASTSTSASYALTSSYALTASFVSLAQTASYVNLAQTASYAVSSSYANTSSLALLGIITASALASTITFTKGDQTTFDVVIAQSGSVQSASYATFAENARSASYSNTAVSSSYAVTSSLALLGIVTASVNASTITFTKGDQTTFDITVAQSGSVQSASYATFAENAGAASTAISASYSDTSISASYAVSASYASVSDTAVSASYALSASHADTASIANIQYVTNSGNLALGQLQVLDYSDSVATTYVNGLLTLVFGTPATPSSLVASISGFATDRFNQVTDNYTVNSSWSNGGYTLISASLYEGNTLLTGITDSGTSISYNTTTSGSHTYRLAYTASSPLDSSIYTASVITTGTLSKTNPGNPTISATPVIQLGAASNQIEEGATGSITFTSASGASNGWTFNYETSNVQSPYIVTGSLTGSTAISLTATAYYSSSGAGGSDNNPPLSTSTTTTTTYSKIRSLRSGATLNSSYSPTQLENLSDWDTTLGGTVGTIKKGTLNPTGQSVTINWTGSLYQYIVYDSAYANLTAINSSGFNVSASFTLTVTGSYKVYRSTAVQAGYGGTTVTYTLI